MKIVALAGGVGGAKLVGGLAQCLNPVDMTVIVNSGDDFEHLGLKICPDLDTVCYTLAGLANPLTGWGRRDESWNTLESLVVLGAPNWFRLGDHDLATHLERTRRMRAGDSLSQITRDFCQAWGVKFTVLPMTDDATPTWVYTEDGEMPFQEYFVHQQCRPRVTGFRFMNIEGSKPAPGVLESISTSDAVIICPSNPWVSIDPILAVPGIQNALSDRPVIAVSPIIGGWAIKGPAAKMYQELGIEPSALNVAKHYAGLLKGFVADQVDVDQSDAIRLLGIQPIHTDTIMETIADRRRLAEEVLSFAVKLMDA